MEPSEEYELARRLFEAVCHADAPAVRTLLAQGADANAGVGEDMQPALHAAAERGLTELTRLMLEHGAEVNEPNVQGETPLHVAAEEGHAACIRLLAAHGAELQAETWEGETPLLAAIYRQQEACVLCLLELGRTPWHALARAALAGEAELRVALEETGLELNAVDAQGYTLLDLAAAMGWQDTCSLLLRCGAEMEQTPLHHAAYYGHLPCVRLLLELGAAPQARDERGRTPLHLAAVMGHGEPARLFLQRGVELEARDALGATPLLEAAYGGHTELMSLLLEHGANPNVRDHFGYTPLSRAARFATDARALRLLFTHGAEIPAFSIWGGTLWHGAARNTNVEVLEELFSRGIPLPDKREECGTLLHDALERPRNLEFFLRHGVKVCEALDCRGEGKPLHAAAAANLRESVDLLLRFGAVADEQDYRGKTPAQCAEEAGHAELACLLRKLAAGSDRGIPANG